MNRELKRIKRNGKWGFIDDMGKIVIPCQWNEVGSFSEGMATIVNKKGKTGFIDETPVKLLSRANGKRLSISAKGLLQ